MTRKSGRPRKAPHEKRTEPVRVMTTQDELVRLQVNARYAHRSVARYIRETALAACTIEPPSLNDGRGAG